VLRALNAPKCLCDAEKLTHNASQIPCQNWKKLKKGRKRTRGKENEKERKGKKRLTFPSQNPAARVLGLLILTY